MPVFLDKKTDPVVLEYKEDYDHKPVIYSDEYIYDDSERVTLDFMEENLVANDPDSLRHFFRRSLENRTLRVL